MRSYRDLLQYALRQWPWLVAIVFLTAISSVLAALQPWPLKLLVDYAFAKEDAPRLLAELLRSVRLNPTPVALIVVAGASTFVLYILCSALAVGLSVCWTVGGQQMMYDLAGDLFARLQRLSLLFHSRQSVGDSMSRLSGDTKCINSLCDNLLMSPIQEAITLAVMIGVGFALDPILAVLAVCLTPLLALSSKFFGKRLKQRSKLGRQAKSRLMSFVHQTLSAVPLVQAFGTQSRHTRHFQDLADDAVVLEQRGNLLSSSYGLVNGLISSIGIAFVLYVGGMRVLTGAIPLGTLLVFLHYVRHMQSSSGELFTVFAKLKAAEASIDRIMEVIDSEEFIRNPAEPIPLPDIPREKCGHIRLESVTFGYELDRPTLCEVTLEARPGEAVALVGPTGAGKSTLVSLIPRFLDPWNGQITFDGVDLRKVNLDELRRRISIVLQEPFLFPSSIADNIAYGRPEARRNEIVEAAKAAQADAFIRRLPDGYDTVVGERGATLSVGERQRLSIARAFLKDVQVLILDEPTSAVDVQTEASLVEAFQRLMQGRTTFIIAHRLSTIRHAHRIVVLDEGRVVDRGSHEELLNRDGLYRRYYDHQFLHERTVIVA